MPRTGALACAPAGLRAPIVHREQTWFRPILPLASSHALVLQHPPALPARGMAGGPSSDVNQEQMRVYSTHVRGGDRGRGEQPPPPLPPARQLLAAAFVRASRVRWCGRDCRALRMSLRGTRFFVSHLCQAAFCEPRWLPLSPTPDV